MDDLIEKMILTGLGAISLTRERAEKFVDELVKKGEIEKEKQPDFVKKMLERGESTRKEIESLIEKSVTNVIKKLNLPTKEDIETLNKKIEKLEKKIEKGTK